MDFIGLCYIIILQCMVQTTLKKWHKQYLSPKITCNECLASYTFMPYKLLMAWEFRTMKKFYASLPLKNFIPKGASGVTVT